MMNDKRTTVYNRAELTRLLNPASVAVIGASTRAGSFGERVLHNLRHYGGRFYPVNARYQTIGDLKCYPSVRDLPEVVDCAVITAAREEDFWWTDGASFALNGELLRDYFTSGLGRNPIAFASEWYLHYPALTISLYPPIFPLAEMIVFTIFGFSTPPRRLP